MDLTKSSLTGHNAQGVPISSFNQNAIKHKTTLLTLAAELGNVSKACKLIGFSRNTFYRYQKAVVGTFKCAYILQADTKVIA